MNKLAASFLMVISFLLVLGLQVNAHDNEYLSQKKTGYTKTVYITKLYTEKNKSYMVVDYIKWFEGQEAEKEIQKAEPESQIVDGYYISNKSNKLRVMEIAEDAEVRMQIYNRTGDINDMDIKWNEKITLTKLINIFNENRGDYLNEYPYHIVIKNGKVVEIVQQYIP